MKIETPYNEELKEYIKSVGGKWDPASKAWDIPDEAYDDVKYKAMEMGLTINTYVGSKRPSAAQQQTQVQAQAQVGTRAQPASQGGGARGAAPAGQGAASQGKQGTIWLGRSKDGRFLVMRINLVAFADDVQAVLSGQKKAARFRVMAARPRPQARTQ